MRILKSYAIGAVVLVLLLEPVGNAFALPGWIRRLVVLGALVGLPVAAIVGAIHARAMRTEPLRAGSDPDASREHGGQ